MGRWQRKEVIGVLVLPLSSFAVLGQLRHLSVLLFSHLYLLNGVVVRLDGGIVMALGTVKLAFCQHMINICNYLS